MDNKKTSLGNILANTSNEQILKLTREIQNKSDNL